MALLELRQLRRSFGSLAAVDGVTLDVEASRITGLIGPNGAGKTTLFNLVAGALAPDAGEIFFAGQRITGEPPERIFHRGLARTFQVPRPFAQMTVLENLMLVPAAQAGERFWRNWLGGTRIAAEERRAREQAMAVLELCALAGKAAELAGQLSGGQHKLLELARVLMIEPRLILLDEPAAGVNPALLETLVERIVRLNRERGISFLVIEHNMDLVMSVCAPIVVMMGGRVVTQGDAASIRSDRRVLDAYLGEVPGAPAPAQEAAA
ncbi:MAG: ABC transporter ATP-binding protein [Rubrivivax sp.]|nr:ABC transporter ATP-binding protein [Rubrivivax sp.]